MKTPIYCDPARTYIIYVDSYDNKVLCGRIHNVLLGSTAPFTGAIDLLLKIEAFLDDAKLVQSYSAKRVFAPGKPAEMTVAESPSSGGGKLASFTFKLLFRQNVSWQGSVLWHEGNSEETFRSVLELLLLVDNALSH